MASSPVTVEACRRHSGPPEDVRPSAALAQADEADLGEHGRQSRLQPRLFRRPEPLTHHGRRNSERPRVLEQGKHPLGLRLVRVGDVPAAHRQNEGGALHGAQGVGREPEAALSALGRPRALFRPVFQAPTTRSIQPNPDLVDRPASSPRPLSSRPPHLLREPGSEGDPADGDRPDPGGPGSLGDPVQQSRCSPGPPARRVDRLSVREVGAEEVRSFRHDPDPGRGPELANPAEGHVHHGEVAHVDEPVVTVLDQCAGCRRDPSSSLNVIHLHARPCYRPSCSVRAADVRAFRCERPATPSDRPALRLPAPHVSRQLVAALAAAA